MSEPPNAAMSDPARSESTTAMTGAAAGAGWRQGFEKLVRRAQAALWWEGAWPALWAPIGVAAIFLAVSWLGLWLDLTPLAPADRPRGLCAARARFLLAADPPAAARTWARARSARPRCRPAATARPGARGYARARRRRYRRRARFGSCIGAGPQAIASLGSVAPPRPDMPRRDRYALRAAALLARPSAAFVAGRRSGSRARRRLRLARAPAAGRPVPDRRLDRPAALHPPAAADDRSRGRRAAPAGAVGSTVVVRVAGARRRRR